MNIAIKFDVSVVSLSTSLSSAKQLTFLENLHPGNDAFFNAKRVAGEYALACILDIAIALEPSLLEKFPKLNNFYTSIMTDFAFIENKDLPMYYSRK